MFNGVIRLNCLLFGKIKSMLILGMGYVLYMTSISGLTCKLFCANFLYINLK
jgi:hypothetical protein